MVLYLIKNSLRRNIMKNFKQEMIGINLKGEEFKMKEGFFSFYSLYNEETDDYDTIFNVLFDKEGTCVGVEKNNAYFNASESAIYNILHEDVPDIQYYYGITFIFTQSEIDTIIYDEIHEDIDENFDFEGLKKCLVGKDLISPAHMKELFSMHIEEFEEYYEECLYRKKLKIYDFSTEIFHLQNLLQRKLTNDEIDYLTNRLAKLVRCYIEHKYL